MVVGALSHNVATYIASAMLLGVYFAMQSGTVDAIVYDTLVEETGDADGFEQYGRIQTLNSLALTASALAGGLIAALVSARATYLLTIPTSIAGLVMLTRFREPTLHRTPDKPRLREHLSATWHTVTRQQGVAPIALAMMLAAATSQMLFEFGPLWLLRRSRPHRRLRPLHRRHDLDARARRAARRPGQAPPVPGCRRLRGQHVRRRSGAGAEQQRPARDCRTGGPDRPAGDDQHSPVATAARSRALPTSAPASPPGSARCRG